MSKRMLIMKKVVDQKTIYSSQKAFEIALANAKEHESVDIAIVLGTDRKKSDEVVKGLVTNVPSGLGKKINVAVFTKDKAEEMKEAGADSAGFDNIISDIKEGKEADLYIAPQNLMLELAKLGIGRLLKSKMPNPKFGTVVTENKLKDAVKEKKAGQISYRSNASVIHVSIGKASFTKEQLDANYQELMASVISARPTKVKPQNYIKRIYCSSTMGLSLQIESN